MSTEVENKVPSLWTVKDVARFAGVQVRAVWRWSKLEEFPKPVRVGKRYTRWYSDDIIEFFEKQRNK